MTHEGRPGRRRPHRYGSGRGRADRHSPAASRDPREAVWHIVVILLMLLTAAGALAWEVVALVRLGVSWQVPLGPAVGVVIFLTGAAVAVLEIRSRRKADQ